MAVGRPRWGAGHPDRSGERAQVLRVGKWMPAEIGRGATGLAPLKRRAVLLGEPEAVWQHWVPGATQREGRNRPCLTDACPHCAKDLPVEWWAYVWALTTELPEVAVPPAAPPAGPDPADVWAALEQADQRVMVAAAATARGVRPDRWPNPAAAWETPTIQALLIVELRRRGLVPAAITTQAAPPPRPPRPIVPCVVELTRVAGATLLDVPSCRGLLVEPQRNRRATAADPTRVSLRMIKREDGDLPAAQSVRPTLHQLWGRMTDLEAVRWEPWEETGHIREDLAREGWIPDEGE